MILNYKFRLYPSLMQQADLNGVMGGCRWLYNHFLERKNESWSYAEIQAEIPKLRVEHDFIDSIHSKVRQYVLWQLRSNIKALGQLKKKGKRVGRLRFKGKGRYNCFAYNQTGFKLLDVDKHLSRLSLSKVGDIPIRLHRVIDGLVKQVYVKKTKTGKWYAIFSVEKEKQDLPKTGGVVGIDLNLSNFLTDSDGDVVRHPHHIKKLEKRIAKASRRMHKQKKGSSNRGKQRFRLVRLYERVGDARNDFLHKLSHYYITNFDFIASEDLSVKDMMESSYNAKNISDSSWSTFNQMLSYKAESAGKTHVLVDPRNTTKMCSGCGNLVSKHLWNRVHDCPSCGLKIDRDYNAAINILHKAQQEVGQGLSELTPVENQPLHHDFGCGASSFAETGSTSHKPTGDGR